ncbi:MAG: TPM domain-containing protein [Bacteroidetes bacterium]|nr:TPM domain-containing protein [Bacteroidota bacterium]
MKSKSVKGWIILFLLGLISFTVSPEPFHNQQAIRQFPSPVGYVNDFDSIFTFSQKYELDSILRQFEKLTTNEFAIVTVGDINPYDSLQHFSEDLGNFWGVGKEGKDNGLLLVICSGCRGVYLEPGLGTRRTLQTAQLQEVINYTIVPKFKSGKYYEGTKAGVLKCIELWK